MVDLVVNNECLENVELVIFDRDGTLIDLYHYWAQMIEKRADLICKHYGIDDAHRDKLMFEMGIDVINRKIRPEGPVGIKKRENVMQAAIDYLEGIGISDTHDPCFEIFKEVDRLSKNNLADLIKPLDGALSLIEKLRSRGCKTAIATTDKTQRARLSMEFLGWDNKLDYIIGSDSVKNSKPAADMANVIIRELKVAREHTVMVGDAITDIKMAHNADLLAGIAVCTGITAKEHLKQLTDFVINDISKIKMVDKCKK